jgi:hypothetical protein
MAKCFNWEMSIRTWADVEAKRERKKSNKASVNHHPPIDRRFFFAFLSVSFFWAGSILTMNGVCSVPRWSGALLSGLRSD